MSRRASRLRRLRQMSVPVAPTVNFGAGTYGGATATSDGTTIGLDGMPDRRTLAHEVAHNLDAQTLTDADRARFSRIMGMDGKPWDHLEQAAGQAAGQMVTRHDSASERFADMVAMLETKQFPRPGRAVGYAYLQDDPPNLRQLLRFGRSLERLQARRGLGVYDEKAIRQQALDALLAQRKAAAARRR